MGVIYDTVPSTYPSGSSSLDNSMNKFKNDELITSFLDLMKVIKLNTVKMMVAKNQRKTPAFTESTCSPYLAISLWV